MSVPALAGGSRTAGRSKLRAECESSLRRLRLEQIPLYQFHRPDPKVPIEESIGALVGLKDEGKIRHIGVSNVSEHQLREAQRLTAIVSVQNRYNAADRSSDSMVDLCEQEMITFIPWAPIQAEGSPAVTEAAGRHEATPRQILLAWLLARSPAMLPIPGHGIARACRGERRGRFNRVESGRDRCNIGRRLTGLAAASFRHEACGSGGKTAGYSWSKSADWLT